MLSEPEACARRELHVLLGTLGHAVQLAVIHLLAPEFLHDTYALSVWRDRKSVELRGGG